jgi:hypothetical protein
MMGQQTSETALWGNPEDSREDLRSHKIRVAFYPASVVANLLFGLSDWRVYPKRWGNVV